MRHERLSHLEAYDEFYKLKHDPTYKLPGLGPAFFTKLIFFCLPPHKGYIMDQWTAKSVNLLTGKNIVSFSDGYVSEKNTICNYECFCEVIEQLGQRLHGENKEKNNKKIENGEKIEMAMFSRGVYRSEKRWPWRQYVIKKMPKYTKEQKRKIWNKGDRIEGEDPEVLRMDAEENKIKYDSYDTKDKYGWKIKSVRLKGEKNSSLQPVHSGKNR
jgi:hypothetical protein